jgi:hypothetical protein
MNGFIRLLIFNIDTCKYMLNTETRQLILALAKEGQGPSLPRSLPIMCILEGCSSWSSCDTARIPAIKIHSSSHASELLSTIMPWRSERSVLIGSQQEYTGKPSEKELGGIAECIQKKRS